MTQADQEDMDWADPMVSTEAIAGGDWVTETKCAPRLTCERGCWTVHTGEITRRNEVPCDSLQAALSPPLPKQGHS